MKSLFSCCFGSEKKEDKNLTKALTGYSITNQFNKNNSEVSNTPIETDYLLYKGQSEVSSKQPSTPEKRTKISSPNYSSSSSASDSDYGNNESLNIEHGDDKDLYSNISNCSL